MTDPIADMLTRIRNAVVVKKSEIQLPCSNIKFGLAKILQREGFIVEVEKVERAGRPIGDLRLVLKYKKGQSVIQGINRISKPGRRVYFSYKDIPRTLPSLGVMIVSTSRGLMTNFEARQEKVGGEAMCEIY